MHPASESDFLSGIFSGGSIVLQISFVMLIFPLFSNQFFLGEGQIPRANCLREKTAVSGTMYQNTEMNCLSDRNNTTVSNFCLLLAIYHGFWPKMGQNPYCPIVSAQI